MCLMTLCPLVLSNSAVRGSALSACVLGLESAANVFEHLVFDLRHALDGGVAVIFVDVV